MDIAAVNGSQSCVVAGSVNDVLDFKKELSEQDIPSIELKTSHAFHSRMMLPAVKAFKEFLSTLQISKPSQPMFSTVTTNLESDLFGTADYWANHIVETVQFSRTIAKVFALPSTLLLEVGTKNILSNLAKKEMAHGSWIINDNRYTSIKQCFFGKYKFYKSAWRSLDMWN